MTVCWKEREQGDEVGGRRREAGGEGEGEGVDVGDADGGNVDGMEDVEGNVEGEGRGLTHDEGL
jgi:hypothetical protein